MAVTPPSPINDRAPQAAMPIQPPSPAVLVSDAFAKDAVLAWFRSEFAASNAIIDALCGHLAQLGSSSEYDGVFSAVHRRRMNWIPVLQMQKYHSIAEVAVELSKVAEMKKTTKNSNYGCCEEEMKEEEREKEGEKEKEVCLDGEKVKMLEKVTENVGHSECSNGEVVDELEEDTPDSDITDSGSQEAHARQQNVRMCTNHEDCEARSSQIKLTKGFSAKEPVKGHMVNVVKGLKLYDNIFNDSELSKLTTYVSELRVAGQNGQLSGETYILFNKQIKGNKRELVQFGVPIFGHVQEEATDMSQTSNIEPIPALLEDAIDHMIQWQLLPVYKKPNSCIINFFDEGEYSQPFLKPPHLEQPIATLFLSESTMVLGRFLVSDSEGNYKGPLMLPLKEGSLLVMRGNSADMARHVMCPSPNKRVTVTFFRVRPDSTQCQSPTSPLPGALTCWQPTIVNPYTAVGSAVGSYDAMDMAPKWGVVHAPVVMLAPVSPMVLSPKKVQNGGTGVFLPWAGGSRKPTKHLPPRAQKNRLLALTSIGEMDGSSTSETNNSAEGKVVTS